MHNLPRDESCPCLIPNPNCLQALYDPTSDSSKTNKVLDQMELFFTAIFTLECVLKTIAYGFLLNHNAYLRDFWNILDFLVVVTSYIALVPQFENFEFFRALRMFRVIKPLRVVNRYPKMKVLVNTMVTSLPMLGDVAILGGFFLVSWFTIMR